MISKQLILSQMGLGWAFPGRSQLGVINLDLTKEIDFLPALRISVNIGVYNPVKGNTLPLCPELERTLGIVTSLFFSFLSGATKCLPPHLGSHLKFHLTVLEVSSVTSNPTKW